LDSNYTELSNVAPDILTIIPHGVEVEARLSLAKDLISWRQSKPTHRTLCDKVVVRKIAGANSRLLAGDDPKLDKTYNDNVLETK
jgi:hypothetical protein